MTADRSDRRIGRDDLDECWCCGGLHDGLGLLCPDCDDAGCQYFDGQCRSEHKPVVPDGGEPPTDTMAGNFPTYIIDGTLYVVARGKLWRRTGQTHNPRVIALADAVGSGDGALLTVHTDGPMVLLQHHISGIEERIHATEQTDWCYVTFEEVETLW